MSLAVPSGNARSWHGLVPARVVDHNDPKKMGRLKVQFFWQDDGSTHWARATSPHAGPDRGFMFMPRSATKSPSSSKTATPNAPSSSAHSGTACIRRRESSFAAETSKAMM